MSVVLLAANPLPLALVACLEDLDYEVVTAEDGRGVLGSLQRQTPNMLILDADMLMRSGLGTCDSLHRALKRRDLPVVMTSARSGFRERSAAQVIGADFVLNTPIPGEVAAVVEGLLGNLQGNQEAAPARLWRTAS